LLATKETVFEGNWSENDTCLLFAACRLLVPLLPAHRYGFNMRCIKELAMAEPLVDTVEPNQVTAQQAAA
jgi:hypothetical protein